VLEFDAEDVAAAGEGAAVLFVVGDEGRPAAAGLALGVLVSYYFAHGNEQLVWMLTRGAL